MQFLMIPMTHRGWRKGVVVVSGGFWGGIQGGVLQRGEDAVEDIMMALETDREPGQKSVLIYSTWP